MTLINNNNIEKVEKVEEEKKTEIKTDKNVDISPPVVVKRKRGRPKKIRTEEEKKMVKVKKKRGRKPRIKTNEVKDTPTTKKKRGRKRRDRFYSLSKGEKSQLFDKKRHQDSIIVKLPIDIDSLEEQHMKNFNNDNLFIENSILTYKPNLDTPKPYEPSTNVQNFTTNNNETESLHNNEIISTTNENNIENLMNSYKEVEYHLHERGQSIKTDVKNTMNEFLIANKTTEWVNSTNIRCWWCCYEFDNKPIGIPILYKENKFHVYGCFCSFNCALSYNFNTDDNKKWERIGLIHLLYKKIYNTKEVKLSYAPDREFLKIFGGHLDINKFRNPNEILKKYEVVYPPMLSIIPQLEETEIYAESSNMRRSKQEIPVDQDRIQRARDKLKLKRQKPLREHNTLEQCMKLTRNKS
jgi:hypothetical protein|tara:strand:+ start:10565 stop:11794 length:1230 start_codon:yes stop_codon:yes gene_type:complete